MAGRYYPLVPKSGRKAGDTEAVPLPHPQKEKGGPPDHRYGGPRRQLKKKKHAPQLHPSGRLPSTSLKKRDRPPPLPPPHVPW